jgi:hypothetical protein
MGSIDQRELSGYTMRGTQDPSCTPMVEWKPTSGVGGRTWMFEWPTFYELEVNGVTLVDRGRSVDRR